jgi:hypothetical protein
MNIASLTVAIVLSVIMLMTFLIVISNPTSASGDASIRMLVLSTITLVSSLAFFAAARGKKPLSVHDFRSSHGSSAFMKKCVNCNKEIPLAAEQCSHCGAAQPEYGA